MPAKKPHPLHLVLEGVDNTGKSTLIKQFIDRFGPRPVIHYTKPEKTSVFSGHPDPLQEYQYQSFVNGLHLLQQNNCPIVFDRFHLGEVVYSPRYRGYDGSYVFDLEGLIDTSYTKLVLLTTSNWTIIEDDGLSFDFSKKEEEQNDFIEAFHKSRFANKQIVDIWDGKRRKTPNQILNELYGDQN